MLANSSGAHMLDPAMRETEAEPVSIASEGRKAWVVAVFADEKPKVRVE